MQLKTSNKFSLIFILLLATLVAFLFLLSGNNKEEKYPATPEFEQKTNLDLIQITFSEKAFKKI